MSNVPILNLETSLFLEEEIDYIQSSASLSNGSTITLDNSGNMKKHPIINITLNEEFTAGLTVTNQTTGISVVIADPTISYAVDTIFTIYSDSVFIGNTEISAIFSAPFVIAENIINTLIFTLPEGNTVDVSIQWTRPNGSQIEELYVQNFSLNQVDTITKFQVNKLNKHTYGYYTTDTTYNFTIDKLFYDNYHFKIDSSKSYRLSWKTDTDVSDIEHMTKYLCGVKFSSIGISHGEAELIKEGLQGSGCVLLD